MNTKYLFFTLYLLFLIPISAQNYPGGVTGSEVWYIANWNEIASGNLQNHSSSGIKVDNCGSMEGSMFNFNPSINSENLCLNYPTSLENSTGRNIFFVGEPNKLEYSFSHTGATWREGFPSSVPTESSIRNFFDLNNKSVYTHEILENYLSEEKVRVNFYHLNHYNVDRKFKSYGLEGETSVYIGKLLEIDTEDEFEDNKFNGEFPEFISFPRELSANERIRVNSYLALKYGLTLNENISYLSSKNIIFWNKNNNNIFKNDIFGLGKDEISGLYQYQSESSHNKGHLIAAIEDILANNIDKQEELENIKNNHFLVFGDNGKKLNLQNQNADGLKFGDKIWLAQRTGSSMERYPIDFKLYLPNPVRDHLLDNPDDKLWLMKDRFVGNGEQSDFNNENVEYFEGELNIEENYGYFSDVFFDSDFNVYDQFTFGVGPEMIVQANLIGCKNDELEIKLTIIGGSPEYHISVESVSNSFNEVISGTTFNFSVQGNETYDITVVDVNGFSVTTQVVPEPWNFILDLGEDQSLFAEEPEIVLDAGVGIDDPDATYEWYFNGVLMPHTESTITVDEAGEYSVIVTSADQSCSVEDSIIIEYRTFEAHVSVNNGCGEQSNSILIEIQGGFPPYTTALIGESGTTNYLHENSITITDVTYGTYEITTTDSIGESYTNTITITLSPENLGVDVYAQLESVCDDCFQYDYLHPYFNFNNDLAFQIDASIGSYSPYLVYEWYLNETDLVSIDPIINFLLSDDCYPENGEEGPGLPLMTLVVFDPETNCSTTQSFYIRQYCPENSLLLRHQANTAQDIDDIDVLTRVYPNPSKPFSTFNLDVSSTEIFNGTVEIFTVTGVRINRVHINGSSTYTLPFTISSSGMYLIKTTTNLGVVKINKVIIK